MSLRLFVYSFVAIIALCNAAVADQTGRDCIPQGSLASTEGLVSSMVNGCVSAISGEYIDAETDIELPGPKPLMLQRTYCSGQYSQVHLQRAWQFNHPHELKFNFSESEHHVRFTAFCGEPSGSLLQYAGSASSRNMPKDVICPVVMSAGATNCGGGEISARTNLRNKHLSWNYKDRNIVSVDGAGEMRVFTKASAFLPEGYYNQLQHLFPNGHCFNYSYNDQQAVSGIFASHANGTPYAALQFIHQSPKDFSNSPMMSVATSDNRFIHYHFHKDHAPAKSSAGYTNYYLAQVDRPDKPQVKYQYQTAANTHLKHITRKGIGDNFFIENEYYTLGYNPVDGLVGITIDTPSDYRLNRVRCQRAPVDIDGTPIITHRFLYHTALHEDGKGKKQLACGSTEVFNTLGHRTVYNYDGSYRLTSIEAFLKNTFPYQLYRTTGYSYNAQGDLACKYTTDANGVISSARSFEYDPKGNIIVDRSFGKITGVNTTPIQLDGAGVPLINGAEHAFTIYSYTQDNFNKIATEQHSNGLQYHNYYHPGTDLLAARYAIADGSICRRSFYTYDPYGTCIEEINDDGSSPLKDDLTGITGRFLTVTQPKPAAPAMGLPQVVGQWFLDPANGNKGLLSNTINHYLADGRLICQQIYDSDGQLAKVKQWSYDGMGNNILETDPLGHTIERLWDSSQNMIFIRGPNKGSGKFFTYDNANRLVKIDEVHDDGQLLTSCNRYDFLNRKIASIDAYGNETNYEYDELGRLTATILPAVCDAEGLPVRYVQRSRYDAADNPVAVTDPAGNIICTQYNANGKPLQVNFPDGTCEKTIYDINGNVLQHNARNGVVSAFTYDAFNRQLTETITSGLGDVLNVKTNTYRGNLLMSTQDIQGTSLHYSYDAVGRVSAINKNGRISRYQYDACSRLHKQYDYFSDDQYTVKTIHYDQLDRIIAEQVDDENGKLLKKLTYGYDADGNKSRLSEYRSESGEPSTTTTLFNSMRMPKQITDAAGQTTHFNYNHAAKNELGQSVFQAVKTDPKGIRTVTTHDALGRVSTTEVFDSFGMPLKKRLQRYDGNGQLIKTIDTVIVEGKATNEVITAYHHNSMQQLTKLVEAVDTAEQRTTQHTYNNLSQKTTTIKADGNVIHYGYDAYGRLVEQYDDHHTLHYTFEFNDRNQIVSVLDQLTGHATKRAYDDNGHLNSETLANGLKIEYKYDRFDRITELALPDQSLIAYGYDGMHMRTVARKDAAGNERYCHAYEDYDLAGALLKEKHVLNGGSADYAYDDLGRQIAHTAPLFQETIAYDEIGNIVMRQRQEPAGSMEHKYAYDSLNQVTTELGHCYKYDSMHNRLQKDGSEAAFNALHQLQSDGCASYRYDANGCLTEKICGTKTIKYRYDALNRLIAIQSGDEQWHYQYDAFNRRIAKRQGDDCTQFLYVGQNEIGAYQNGHAAELRILGRSKGAEIGASVAIELNNQLFIPYHDSTGNIVVLADAFTGACVESYRYTAFGEETLFGADGTKTQSSINPWRLSSKRIDPESGLIYYGRRYYEPSRGAWMTPDPAGYEVGPNLYAYVNNNPLCNIDLYGLAPVCASGNYWRNRNPERQRYSRPGIQYIREYLAYPGQALSYAGHHLIPFSGIKDLITLPGHLLQGKDLSEYVPSYRQKQSELYILEHDANAQVKSKNLNCEVNGIANSFDEATEHARKVWYENNGEMDIYFYYSASHGLVADLAEALLKKMGVMTHGSHHLYESICYLTDKVPEGGFLDINAHSRGGLLVNYVSYHLTDEQRDMMRVATYGSAHIIRNERFHMVRNYVSKSDIVPLICNPWSYGSTRMFGNPNYDVRYMDSDKFFGFDHSWDKAYTNAWKYQNYVFNKG